MTASVVNQLHGSSACRGPAPGRRQRGAPSPLSTLRREQGVSAGSITPLVVYSADRAGRYASAVGEIPHGAYFLGSRAEEHSSDRPRRRTAKRRTIAGRGRCGGASREARTGEGRHERNRI